MPADPTFRRWLILDQETDCKEWGVPSGSSGIVLTESSIQVSRPELVSGSPAAEICVVFLPELNSGWQLPDRFDNRAEKHWKVWCHYGRGDIDPARLSERWTGYDRLSDSDKPKLLHGDRDFPKPFSRGQFLKWTPEFMDLKKLIKGFGPVEGQSKSVAGDTFEQCLNSLQEAWALASVEIGVQDKVRQNKEILTTLLAAQFVLGIIPREYWSGKSAPSPRDLDYLTSVLKKTLEGFQACGLAFMRPTAKLDRQDWLVTSHARMFHEFDTASRALAPEYRGRLTCDMLTNRIRALARSLKLFTTIGELRSKRTTKELRSNPRTLV